VIGDEVLVPVKVLVPSVQVALYPVIDAPPLSSTTNESVISSEFISVSMITGLAGTLATSRQSSSRPSKYSDKANG